MKTEDGWKKERRWTGGRKKMDAVKKIDGQNEDGWKEERKCWKEKNGWKEGG